MNDSSPAVIKTLLKQVGMRATPARIATLAFLSQSSKPLSHAEVSAELKNLGNKALPVYLLGIIGIFAGSADTAITSIMLGQASVQDGFTYYSRNQEASADQAAVNLMCSNNINASVLICNF